MKKAKKRGKSGIFQTQKGTQQKNPWLLFVHKR